MVNYIFLRRADAELAGIELLQSFCVPYDLLYVLTAISFNATCV